MPLRDSTVFCVNHPNVTCQLNNTFNSLTSLKKTAEGVTFEPGSGVPVVVYVCPECGYVELYVAIKTPFWAKGSIP